MSQITAVHPLFGVRSAFSCKGGFRKKELILMAEETTRARNLASVISSDDPVLGVGSAGTAGPSEEREEERLLVAPKPSRRSGIRSFLGCSETRGANVVVFLMFAPPSGNVPRVWT
jgi:hypothetical protein